MPVTNNRANFDQFGRLRPDPDENNRSDRNQKRGYRVHHDAQGTTIGVSGGRMRIRYVKRPDKHQQYQAHHSREPQSA